MAYPVAVFYGEHSTTLSAVLAQTSSNMTFTQETSQNIETGLVSAKLLSRVGYHGCLWPTL